MSVSRRTELLLPIIRAQSASLLLRIGDALIRNPDCAGNALGLVEIPKHSSERLTHEVVLRRRELLRWIARIDEGRELDASARLGILVRAVHDVALGIREAVYETGASLLLVEWPGLTSRRPHLLARVVRELVEDAPVDLLLVRPGLKHLPAVLAGPRILVPIRGGPNAERAAWVASSLAAAWNGSATLLHLVNLGDPPARRRQEAEAAARLADRLIGRGAHLEQREADDVGRAILTAARDADFVVLGAYARQGSHPVVVRPELASSLRRLGGTVILVRTQESLRPWQQRAPHPAASP